MDALVGDAWLLLDRFADGASSDADGTGSALALLALVAGQDVEWVDDERHPRGGWWRIARRVAGDRVISTVDPESRHAHKTVHRRQDGFKAHVAVEPDTGIVTDCGLTKTTGADNQDAAVGVRLLETEEEPGLEVLGDTAYGTGDARAALEQAGHQAVIKPAPLRPAVPGGYTIDDFTVDEQAGTLTCPAGVTRSLTKTRAAVFGQACRDCPLRARCTTAAKGRIVRLHRHDALLRAARRQADNLEFQSTYRQHRPMVERSIAWLTRGTFLVVFLAVRPSTYRTAGLRWGTATSSSTRPGTTSLKEAKPVEVAERGGRTWTWHLDKQFLHRSGRGHHPTDDEDSRLGRLSPPDKGIDRS